MSIPKLQDRFRDAMVELKDKPILLVSTAAACGMFIWTQDLIPFAGPVLASVGTSILIARIFKQKNLPWRRLCVVGVLTFPINSLWTIMIALYQNTTWHEPFSTAWAIPVIFFMNVAYAILVHSVRVITVEHATIDSGIKQGFMRALSDLGPMLLSLVFMTMLGMTSLATHGFMFLIFGPVALALLKVSADQTAIDYSDAGLRADS